jgi:hypothetical protein
VRFKAVEEEVSNVLLEELHHGLLLPPEQIQPSPGALDCVLAAQSIKNQRLGGNSTNQTNTGQIENVGTPTINRRAEHKSRTGPDNLLRKRGGGGDWKFRKVHKDQATEERWTQIFKQANKCGCWQQNIRPPFVCANRKAEQIVERREPESFDFELDCPQEQPCQHRVTTNNRT